MATLPTPLLESIKDDLSRVSLRQEKTIYQPGDRIDTVYFPLTGVISELIGSKSNWIEIATIGREGAIGLEAGFGPRRSFGRATVRIAGEFSALPARRIMQLAQSDARLRDVIARYGDMRRAELQQTAACNALHDASSRLCRWLLQTADRAGVDKLPLTQEFLAQMLGVCRTTVTLLARTLQKSGAIEYSRGLITILDRKQLEANACDCYRITRPEALLRAIGADY